MTIKDRLKGEQLLKGVCVIPFGNQGFSAQTEKREWCLEEQAQNPKGGESVASAFFVNSKYMNLNC